MSSPRAVRIPRSPRGESSPTAFALEVGPRDPSELGMSPDRRPNSAGLQRAYRVLAIYLLALVAMYGGFIALDRASPGGTSSITSNGILVFTLLFVGIAIGGVLVTLAPVPRAVEVGSAEVIVVEWTGRRRAFPPISELRIDVVRRFPTGLLSRAPVTTVELTGGGRRRAYQVEEGLLPEHRPGRTIGDA